MAALENWSGLGFISPARPGAKVTSHFGDKEEAGLGLRRLDDRWQHKEAEFGAASSVRRGSESRKEIPIKEHTTRRRL